MNTKRNATAGLVTSILVAALAAAAESEPRLVAAARTFLDQLAPEARRAARLPFDSSERFDWHYVPRRRAGVALGELGGEARTAARALLAAGLSPRGVEKVEGVIRLEEVLHDRSGGSAFRDPGRYFFALFGEPAAGGTWGWRFEGHHVSLHWTIVDGRIVSAAPQFLGANPAGVGSGPHRGLRVLGAEEDRARALVVGLDPARRARAVIDARAPSDILSGNSRRPRVDDRRGIAWSELTGPERAALRALVAEYAGVASEAVSAERMARFDAESAEVRFAWMGGLAPGEGHYYRVVGRSFLVEYDNTQDGANHVHSVWRDLEGEWGVGEDLLARHYRTAPHHRGMRARSEDPGGRGAASPADLVSSSRGAGTEELEAAPRRW